MSLFGGGHTAPPLPLSTTQAARDSAGDEPSKDLISSLRVYDHFSLVVPLSLELLRAYNGLW